MSSMKPSTTEHTSDIESFDSSKSIKLSTNERMERLEQSQENLSNKLDKFMEMFSSIMSIDTKFDARKHKVSSLDIDSSDEDDQTTDASANKATIFIEKPHFSSHLVIVFL
ncbi:hypothetical protein, partial [Streptomyces anthocyanicus]|uniref:hypothetical protein n=1 Tax=Streptomyces anthocyanicus TaxID=68174 RepID=UPI00166FD6F3